VNANNVDTKLMKALAHPLRQKILAALSERVASPSELADELGEPLGNVSYHVRMLVDLGCIELVSTTPRRGALEHHYKAVVRPFFDDAAYATFPTSTKRALRSDVLQEIWTDVGGAADAATLDEDSAHVARHAVTLDEQGVSELSELLAQTSDRIQEIRKASVARLGKNRKSDQAIDTVVATMAFRAGSGSAAAKPKRRKKAATKR
jgi:DNA-binding transcriptional ArsR family regulator